MQTLMKKKEKSKWVLRADAGEASVNQKQDTMDAEYKRRFDRHIDELKCLYMEVYQNEWMFDELCKEMYRFYRERKDSLKKMDRAREEKPDWFKKNDMLGMMLYVDNFADNLQGVRSKLDYLKECHVNYVHLMPLLKTPKGRSDGGYAVADFR